MRAIAKVIGEFLTKHYQNKTIEVSLLNNLAGGKSQTIGRRLILNHQWVANLELLVGSHS
jgi:hypothetical protein